MPVPSKEHLNAFGSLIHHYASVETGLKIVLAGVLNVRLRLILIMTEPYGALDLRRVAKAIAKEHNWPGKSLDTFVQIVGDVKPISPLRNYIAHCRWTEGTRPGAIKPRRVDIREEKARYFGDEDDERDWTAKEIQAEADKLITINARLVQLLADTGLDKRIEANIKEASSPTLS